MKRTTTIFPVVLVFLVCIGVDECTEEERPGEACEIGLAQCGSSLEVCRQIKQNNRSRVGACYCKEGYVRNGGECQPATIGVIESTAIPTSTTNNDDAPFMVNIIGPVSVQLPVSEANLTAVAVENKNRSVENEMVDLKYAWVVKSSPVGGPVVLEGHENRTVHVLQLREGRYVFGVRVTSGNGTGEADWSMTVLAERKEKNPPIAIVQPPLEIVNEKAQVILDGSNSKDPDGGAIVSYVWTQVTGPRFSMDAVQTRTPTLTLSNLPPGNYSFKLTVKDEDGLENSALAQVMVKPEIDYRPKAIAGSCDGTLGDVLVRLPVEALYLCGNMSTDDKAIEKWTWTLKDADKNTADMEGTGSSILKVSNLRTGDYTFHLVVEDEKGQSSSEDVHVVVMPAINKPPSAEAGHNQTIKYPETSAILDGALSSDDKRITSYSWSQIEGPSQAVLTNADQARMTATELQQGVYTFQLNVTDEDGQWDVDQAVVTVDVSDNHPPVASAEDVRVTLPCNVATLDGSASKDDAGVVRWLWTVQEENVAGLELLGNTWKQPVLLVSNLAVGAYVFNLTVFDKQGAAASKLVKLDVVQSDKENQTVEIYLGVRYSEFTIRHKKKLEKQLQVLLETNPNWDRVSVDITKINQDPRDGSVYILFYALSSKFDSSKSSAESILPAAIVANFLQKHWSRSEFMSDFSVNRIDTLYCHSNCSGRGRCQEFTKRCVCDRYWMPNLFSYFSRGFGKDCHWSILYFAVVILLVIIVPVCGVCFILRGGYIRGCFGGWRKVAGKTRSAARRIRRYRVLKEDDQNNSKGLNMRSRRNGHVPIVSDSDLSSEEEEEETVYDRSRLLPPSNREHTDEGKADLTNGLIIT